MLNLPFIHKYIRFVIIDFNNQVKVSWKISNTESEIAQ